MFFGLDSAIGTSFAITTNLLLGPLPVPEPTTAGLLSLGLLGFAARGRRVS